MKKTASNLKNPISLSLNQQDAVELCCSLTDPIVSVTGGAGTGKTTILRQVHEEMRSRFSSSSIVLCAPTGRAAKRIMEATKIPAKTIHRLLEFPRPSDDKESFGIKGEGRVARAGEPRRNADHPLVERVVLVDEASMLGPSLFRQLMEALPKNGLIRFFGDNNQLPPVEDIKGGAAPFKMLLQNEPMVELTFNYRSDDAIISNALRILNSSLPQRNKQFEIIYCDDPVRQMIHYVDKTFTQSNAQIITPLRKGKLGTLAVNPALQLKFNPNSPSLLLDRLYEEENPMLVRKGDKFLWIKNDYTFDMFNGELGTVDDLDQESGELWLGMEDREVLRLPAVADGRGPYGYYQYDPRKQLELGYAATTHKSQGSEFDYVVYYMCGSQPFLLNRNNLYTAVTRAKKHVTIICDRKAMGVSIRKRG